jgi:hypothetical protein
MSIHIAKIHRSLPIFMPKQKVTHSEVKDMPLTDQQVGLLLNQLSTLKSFSNSNAMCQDVMTL